VQTTLNAVVAGVVSPLVSFSTVYLALGMLAFLLLGRLAWMAYLRDKPAAPEHS
jgi:hypothetical protein